MHLSVEVVDSDLHNDAEKIVGVFKDEDKGRRELRKWMANKSFEGSFLLDKEAGNVQLHATVSFPSAKEEAKKLSEVDLKRQVRRRNSLFLL